jgi:hypothetical protein
MTWTRHLVQTAWCTSAVSLVLCVKNTESSRIAGWIWESVYLLLS